MKRRTQTLPTNASHRIDYDRPTPVETHESAAFTKDTQVKIPRSQAFWVALPFSIAVIVTVVSPIALGPRIFWVVCGVCALAAFLWSIAFELCWQDRVSLPFLVALVGLCFWRFADWRGWHVPDAWQPVPALASLAAIIFWWTFTAALWLTFTQRLAQPVYHQQYSLWRAIGAILEHWGTRERTVEAQAAPEPRRVVFEFIHENGRVRHNVSSPVDDDTLIWICRILQEETYSEAAMCGPDKPLPGGAGGREQLDALRDWLIQHGILRWNRCAENGEPIKTQGVSLTEDGRRWVEEVGE